MLTHNLVILERFEEDLRKQINEYMVYVEQR